MSSAGQLSDLFEDYSDDVQFFLIYCREAHPIDGRNPGAKTVVEDPISDEERLKVARKFVADMGLEIPALLDGVDDAASRAYASHPDRLYLIGKDGKVAYAGARGPKGFSPKELRAAIATELAAEKKGERGGEAPSDPGGAGGR